MLHYVGKRIPRKDGPAKATGRAKYTVDIRLSGMLIGRILRSPHAHARILHIDTSRAERLKGVKGVITAGDTGNDLDMMRAELGVHSIAVGNAAAELKAFRAPHVYHAVAEFSAGILEGLRHYGWL